MPSWSLLCLFSLLGVVNSVSTENVRSERLLLSSPCRSLFQRRPNQIHFAREFDSGQDLKGVINGLQGSSSTSPTLLQLNVINGTKWLNLGGSLDTFGLVLGRLPSTSSDMTLGEAVAQLRATNVTTATVITFSKQSLVEQLRESEDLCWQMQALPLWITQSSDSAAGGHVCDGKIPPNLMLEKKFGLDSIIERVSKESLLLPKDFHRVLQTINRAYLGDVPKEDTRFVRTIYRRLDEGSKHSFTDLFLASLLQILDRGIVIGGGEAELLPDLQDEDERYAAGDFAEAMRIISGNRHECHLVTLRAGVLAEEESLEAAKEQLLGHSNALIVAYAKPYDLLNAEKLSSMVQQLGKDRVILQLPSEQLVRDIRNGNAKPSNPPPHKIPVPTTMGDAPSSGLKGTPSIAAAGILLLLAAYIM